MVVRFNLEEPVKRLVLILSAALVLPWLLEAEGPRLFSAIRDGDTAGLQRLLTSGASANEKDGTGTTPLIYAAAYGSERDLTLLLDAGADVNAANTYGSTALMWAAQDAARVKLLLDRGAAVSVRAVDRTTPLLAAARFGNIEAMRLLIARGALSSAVAADTTNLLRVAYTPERVAVRQLLEEHGVKLADPDTLGVPVVGINVSDPPLVERLLGLGASPSQTFQIVTLTVPAVALAASAGKVASIGTLAARGADLNAAGTHGYTPLMMAAASVRPDPAVIRALVDKGADVHARDDVGRTALDWALLQGETPAAAALKNAGARAMAPPAAAPPAVATPRSAGEAIEKAIARLQPAGPVFYNETKCISCHHQSLPAVAVKMAATRGVRVDQALASHPTAATTTMWKGSREPFLLGNAAFGGFVANVGYGLLGMHEEGAPPTPETDAAVLLVAGLQRPDGSWDLPVGGAGGGLRPPLGGGASLNLTSLAIRALSAYMPPSRRAEAAGRIAKAREFLLAAETNDTQEQSFKLLGLVWSGATPAQISTQASRLLALQRADGGWGQLPTMASDAYATGQALYALGVSGTRAQAAPFKKGADYLLRTQLQDGTWFVRSRGFGFQPYFETGFPHGRDQFISAAATSWAAIALSMTL